jgi:hypothetical protein
MRNIIIAIALLSGCLVRTQSTQRTVVRESCPPAHHWEGNACVHNGHGHGHDNHGRGDH